MIDLTIDSPIREPQSKASKLAISFLSPAHVVELINENIEPRKHNRIPNLTKDIPRKTEYSSHKASPEFADNIAFPVQESQFHVPTPSVLAPIVSAPLQDQDSFNASAKRLNQSPVFEQESSTLSQHKNAGGIPLPHVLQQGTGLNPAKFFPAVALPRRTALEVSTPLRLPLVKTLFEPPPLIKNVQHHRHVAFAQYSSKALAEERWGPEQRRETEQRYHGKLINK
ncbi:hypothetical protein J3R30DRAFT_903717 [Lentinula aciculospora]|uniref:Uncharacterized protein n=1 Tax=Lentinula aciculospora TaxID=153920 RepID=A0A9W9AQH0_9AGAR|nr:hypothetical protein J3R30DRAFT_903717 [Lentinula aciculospora]